LDFLYICKFFLFYGDLQEIHYMINPQKGQNLKFDSESAIIKEKY